MIGAAPAGHPFDGSVGPGQTVRLFTGSIVPQGADAILLQEDATRDGDSVRVNEAVKAGRHIRRAGQDFARGDTVVPAGRRITARDVGLAAAANHPWLSVHRRPRVAILATGDEIAMPGEPIPPGGIVSSNSHALAALVRAARRAADRAADRRGHPRGGRRGGRCGRRRRHAGDHRRRLGRRPRPGHRGPAKPRHGGGFLADRHAAGKAAAVRPARAPDGGVPVLGLPGNPVSAMVCSILFLLPALSRLSGLPAAPPPITTPCSARRSAPMTIAPTICAPPSPPIDAGRLVVTPFPVQDSAMLRRLALADALILRPPHAPALPEGAEVPVIRLDSLGL